MTELTKIPTFEGKQIRTVHHNGESWIPVQDLAEAWGTHRTTPYHIVMRNPDAFEGLTLDGDVVSQGIGLCLNERGLYMLMGKITTAKLKYKTARETVLRFQKWVPILIQQYRKGEVAATAQRDMQLNTPDPIQIAIECKKLAKVLNADAQRLIVSAYFKYGYDYLAPHVPPHSVIMAKSPAVVPAVLPRPERPLIETITGKDLVPPSPKPEGMLSATDIGRIIGKTAEQVNQWLYNNKYIVKDSDNPGEWRLDGVDGKTLGTEVPYKPHPAGKRFYRVFWNREILEKFNVKV